MLKSTLILSVFAAGLALAPAHAQTMTCSDADMAKMEANMGKMSDATKKETMMKEMKMAKESMANKDESGCMTHMKNMESMMSK